MPPPADSPYSAFNSSAISIPAITLPNGEQGALGESTTGGLSEYIVVPAENVSEIKEGKKHWDDKVVLTPSKPLRRHARYEVRLSRDLRDFGGNALRPSALTWSFVTGR